jgi:two-component system, OmpR family, alkaline phosphatase synthesis response regulator PhoP
MNLATGRPRILHETGTRADNSMAPNGTRRRSILVVDDEPYIGRIIQLKLENSPYQVDVCQDGVSALDRLRTEDPVDLILLDIMMPNMSGFEVLALLRDIPHRADTPVIMLTGKGQSTDREQAASLGARDFLTKPFSPKKLLARIDEIFTA